MAPTGTIKIASTYWNGTWTAENLLIAPTDLGLNTDNATPDRRSDAPLVHMLFGGADAVQGRAWTLRTGIDIFAASASANIGALNVAPSSALQTDVRLFQDLWPTRKVVEPKMQNGLGIKDAAE